MASSYFKNFPTISYNNTLVTNIIARAKIDIKVRDKNSVFFPYTIIEGERPDTIAANYYEDANFAWLIYYANEIIDPYFEWPLSYDEFKQHIEKKYESVAKSQATISFFRTNWESDETMIDSSAYNSFPAGVKKYWQPIFDYRGYAVSYERSKNNLIVETNRIVQVNHSSAAIFNVGDIVRQGSNTSAIVKAAAKGYIIVEKVQGEFIAETMTDYSGQTSVTVTSSVILKNIFALSSSEEVYWSPVSCFDYEEELNEQRKEIYILDRAYLNQVELEMKTLLI